MDSDVFRGMGAVLFVLALLGASLWALRHAGWYTGRRAGRYSGQNTGWFQRSVLGTAVTGGSGASRHAVQTLDRLALTPLHALHVVRAGGRELLVATHPQGCT